MKLAALKLASLVVLLGGVAILMLNFGCPYMQAGIHAVQGGVGGVLGPGALYTLAGILLILLGLYAFLPKMGGKKTCRSVTTRLEHGAVVTELDPIESQLGRVLSELPEVKSVRVHLTPDKEQRRVRVSSDLVLNAGLDIQTRSLQNRINRQVAEAAVELFGLEVTQPVTLHITGMEIDPKAVSQALLAREDSLTVPLIPAASAEVRMEPVAVSAEEPVEAAPCCPEMPCCGMAAETPEAPLGMPPLGAEPAEEPESGLPPLAALQDEVPSQEEETPLAEPVGFEPMATAFDALEEEKTGEKSDQDRWSLQ